MNWNIDYTDTVHAENTGTPTFSDIVNISISVKVGASVNSGFQCALYQYSKCSSGLTVNDVGDK